VAVKRNVARKIRLLFSMVVRGVPGTMARPSAHQHAREDPLVSDHRRDHDARMMLFEVYLESGSFGQAILSEETMADTGAQLMSDAEAAAAGFDGLPGNTSGSDRRWIACRETDAGRIVNALNMSGSVSQFKPHEIPD
jgi:hypothetical protein